MKSSVACHLPPVRSLAASLAAVFLLSAPAFGDLPADADWQANAVLRDVRTVTDKSIGAGQGVSVHDGHVYVYGDVWWAEPRVGLIRQYTVDLRPTGRQLLLTRGGKPLVTHPTGLTWDAEAGCFLGDTVNQLATIYQLDWDRAWQDGNLDHAVKAVIRDDAAVNGCRPELVTLRGKRLLATADYGDKTPQFRLYDPARLVQAKRTTAPGVVVHRLPCGPFNQNLYWDEDTGEVTCIQNVVAGRGWRLDVFNLAKAIERGGLEGGARVRTLTFNPHDELEGYRPLPKDRALFVTSGLRDNLILGTIRAVEPFPSPAGSEGFVRPREAVP